MDNKNNRLFYWNVKDFLTNKSEEQQIKPKTTLKNSIEGILSENKIYRQNDFCDNNVLTEDVSRYLSRWAIEENKYDPKNVSYAKNSVSNPFMLTENPMAGSSSQMGRRALGAQSSTIQASLNQPNQMASNPMSGSSTSNTQTNTGVQSNVTPTTQNAANIVSNIVSQAGQGAKSLGMKVSSNYDQYSDPRKMSSSQGSGVSDQQAAASDAQRGSQRKQSGFNQDSVSTSTGNSGVADDRVTVDTRTNSSMGNNQGLNIQSFNPKADDRISTGFEKDDSYFKQLSGNISAGGQNLGLNMSSGMNAGTSGNRRRGVMEGILSGKQVTNKIFEAMVMVPGKGYVYMPDTSSGTQTTARPQPKPQPTARPQPTVQPTETAKATEVAKGAEVGKGAQGFKAGFVNQLKSELKGEVAGAKRLISPVTSPVQTAKNIGQGVQSAVKGTGNLVNKTVGAVTNPAQAAKDIATAKNIGKAVNVGKGILTLGGGLGVGEVVEKGVGAALDVIGVPEGIAKESIKSGANWGGMAAGTAVAGQLLAGAGGAAALGAGAAAAVPAAIAGAAILPVAIGSYKAGEAIGGIEVNKKGETVSDKIGEFGYKYAPGVKSLANWSVDANKGVDTRLGENKPKSVAELQALSAKERGETTQQKFGGKSQNDIDEIRAKAAARRAGASDFEKQAMQAPQKLTAEQEAALESPMLKQARLEKEAALKKQQETESQVDPTGQLNRRR